MTGRNKLHEDLRAPHSRKRIEKELQRPCGASELCMMDGLRFRRVE